METGDAERIPAPAGRLRARAELDRVVVELPAYLRPVNVVYGAFVAMNLVLAVVASLSLRLDAALIIGAFVGVTLAVPWAFSRLMAAAIRRVGPSSPAGAAIVWVSLALWLGLCVLALQAWSPWLSASFFAVMAACLPVTAWQAQRAPVVTLHPARLEIRQGDKVQAFLLEDIARIAREPAGWGPEALLQQVRIDGQDVPALRGLTREERAWLLDRIEAAVQRQREALAQQGHDLAEPAPPPAELAALRGREAERG